MASSKVKLPISLVHKGTRFLLVRMLPIHAQDIETIVQQNLRVGSGIGIDEGVAAKVVFSAKDKPGHLLLSIIEEASCSVQGLVSIYPCTLTRSTRPIICGSHIVLKSDFQGHGLFVTLLPPWLKIMTQLGYIGFITRTQWPTRDQRMPALGQVITGFIPDSQLLEGKRRGDDCVYHMPLIKRASKGILAKYLEASIPETPVTSFPEHLLELTKFEPVTFSSNTTELVTLRPAILKDMAHVEDLIRQAAIDGEGFALDEFENGFFNRKFLRRSHTLVATQSIMPSSPCGPENPREHLIGAALFGPTRLCRSESTPTVGCYLIVHPGFRRHGIGKSLLRAVEEISRSNGFNALLSDVFVDNTAGILMASRSDFMCIGSLPKCGVTKNSGLVDSLMYYKYLDETTASSGAVHYS